MTTKTGSTQTTPSRTIAVYKSYSFIDKDPAIDKIRTAINDSGKSYDWIADRSGVNVTTLRNWFGGTTKRPQFATLCAVARALGYDFKLVKK